MNSKSTITAIKPDNLNIDDDPKRLDYLKHVNSERAQGNFNNMLPVVDIAIPDSVLIGCPLAKQHLSQAKHCKSCGHFNGIVQTCYNDEYQMQWDQKYAISCKFPIDRKCATVCVKGEA